jgi:anti-sigma factor RsiW
MTPNAHLSTFALDALALDALTDDEAAQARSHLADCAECRANAEAGNQLRHRFASRIEPTLATARHRQRRWRGWFALGIATPLVAAAVALLVYVRPRPVASTVPPEAELGIKGDRPIFEVYARRGAHVFAVQNDAVLAPGDEIRFAVAPNGSAFVLIASIDGSGSMTVYYPYNGAKSANVDPRSRTELPGSIVLDAAQGPERVVAVFSRAPIQAADLAAKLRRQGPTPSLPALAPHADSIEISITFRKSP